MFKGFVSAKEALLGGKMLGLLVKALPFSGFKLEWIDLDFSFIA